MSTIDYGIDLGTTNSALARQEGRQQRLLPGPDGDPLLPSAIHVLASGEVVVGARARAALDTDPQNATMEFKRLMGTGEKKRFPASGRELTPEELSAEVLRSLCARAQASDGESPRAAVITIPAMFQLPQCDATRRAAALAGIEHAPLLQEPIAAAIAHSGSGEVREGSWLVYDLGGGTFDISLVRCKDGRLQVIDHDGDNHLGGRDFDRAIARKATELIREGGKLGDFKRTDPRNEDAFAKIKLESERVRIALSTAEAAKFSIPDLGTGTGVAFDLDRGGLEDMLGPLIERTTALCLKLLKRNRIEAKELSGLVMVGGPTLTPCVARQIHFDVGVEAKHYVDPMTIVARGAALFASTQRMPASMRRKNAGAAIELHLEYEAMTTDPSPLIVGKVTSPVPPPPGLKITVERDDGQFRAPLSPVQPNGAFAIDLRLQPSQLNVFKVGAVDGAGNPLAVEPDSIKMLHGFSIARPPLSQSVGIMLADNNVHWYLRKGAVLPARQTMTHSTTVSLQRGQSGEAIHVPLVQGESTRADRNKVIGVLHIHADKIDRDLPEGSTVEVTLAVDESAQTIGRAYVPALDQWFEEIVRFDLETKPAADVGKSLAEQKDRLKSLEALADELDQGSEGSGTWVRSESESTDNDAKIKEVEQLLEEGDRDSIDLADQMVRMMAQDIDSTEDGGRKSRLTNELEDIRTRATEVIEQDGEPGDKRQLATLLAEADKALTRGDLDLLERKTDDVRSLNLTVMTRQPWFWEGYLAYLMKEAEKLGVMDLTRKHFERGVQAIQKQDFHEVPGVCREIVQMFPAEQRERVGSMIRSDVK
ncbi:MAG: Hsp70 family protein [Deltaproteobacteria bacterium]|nr:Hsp70 family protein [Deltaproteobacteria bacterium]